MQDQDARYNRSLPAPYQSPWQALREDFPAAIADLRLRLYELWRRNREGDLSTPGFWPPDLAPLFWPGLLVVLLLLLILAGIQLRIALDGVEVDSVPVVERMRTTPLSEDRPLMSDPEPLLDAADASAASPQQAPTLPIQHEPVALPVLQREPPMLQVDPLLTLLEQADADGAGPSSLLLSARPVPADNAAVLVVDTALWSGLPQRLRREQAEGWWQTLQDQGYDAITLEDVDQNLLARSARVGRGMIMFDSLSSP